jgi:hypothetical protein
MPAESRFEVPMAPSDDTRLGRKPAARAERGGFTHKIASIAERDHDVVSVDDLKSCGLSDSGIQKRVQAGQLHPKYPGVYAVGRPELTAKGRRMAAIKACGPNACLSFATAGAHRGMRQTNSSYIDVTIPAGRPLRKLKGIRCHRTDLAPQGSIDRRRHSVHLRLANPS